MKNNFNKNRFFLSVVLLILLIIILSVLSLNAGTYKINFTDFIKTILGFGNKNQQIAIFSLRLPRLALGILLGSALSLSGVILQSVTQNDLAEPSILGISTGSSFFVILFIYFTNGNNYYSLPSLTIFTMPLVALLGGLFTALLIYVLGISKNFSTSKILLMGISINSIFSALIIILQLRFGIKDFNKILSWTMGSIWGANWDFVKAVFPIVILFTILTFMKLRILDIFQLGNEIATSLGVDLKKEKTTFIIFAVCLAAASTSVAGNISFLGLMSPHIARKINGPKHIFLLPTSILIGICLTLFSDLIARNLFSPMELHLGVVMSIIGAPYFIYLLLKSK